jgi:hypothetical protein
MRTTKKVVAVAILSLVLTQHAPQPVLAEGPCNGGNAGTCGSAESYVPPTGTDTDTGPTDDLLTAILSSLIPLF